MQRDRPTTERPGEDATPDELAAWIDTFDGPPSLRQPERVLDEQRTENGDAPSGDEPAADGVARVVNNVGDDGGAATG